MNGKHRVEIQSAEGTTIQSTIYDTFYFDGKMYALLLFCEDEEEILIVRAQEEGNSYTFSQIDDEDEFRLVVEYIQKCQDPDFMETELYKTLNTEEFNTGSYKTEDLGENMAVINESMYGWWKPRYLVNHNTRRAYEFIDMNQTLLTVTEEDIYWQSLTDLPEEAISNARALSFEFPSFIKQFKNGVAEVSWQLTPDGRYYMDADGYGMTDDDEVEIYGFIDTKGTVVVKFKNINKCYDELDKMREEAEKIVKFKKG